MKKLALTGALIATSFTACGASATLLDPSFVESNFVTTGVSQITGMAWAPDTSERLFLTAKWGPVRVIEKGVLLPDPFAVISPVYTSGECGVIGIAFDPNFANNGYVYFFVTVSASEQQIIRYTANGNTGTNKVTIVGGLPTRGANHDGGGIGVGPDGKLYWAIGDNGAGVGINQDLLSLGAKIGRANRDGSPPKDNPFFDATGPNNDFIWALGFRNPFTLTFQPSTERLWVNTVGTGYEQVFTPESGDHAGYNNYESNQPAGFITPVIAYPTNFTAVWPIAANGASRRGGVATFKTTLAHRFHVGEKIRIGNVPTPSLNGAGYVSAVPDASTFSIVQAGPDETSGGGVASTFPIGGCITGGTFWESSSVPASHRGNYFFGDYNTGRIQRGTLDSNNVVTSVDYWATGYTNLIDMDVGPDGNLYFVELAGIVHTAAYIAPAQGIVVSRRYLRTLEGGSTAFHVRLARPPASNVTVAVARASGDSDLSVSEGASLTFSAADWSMPKPVRIDAAEDADSVEDSVTISASSAGLATEDVVVRVTDEDPLALVLSTKSVTITEGQSGNFDVSLSGPPPGPLTVDVSRAAGDVDVSVTRGASLFFESSNWSSPQTVTLTAAQDSDVVNDSASIRVSAPELGAPEVSVTVNDDDSGGAASGGTSGSDGGAATAGSRAQVADSDGDEGCSCRGVSNQSSASASLFALLLIVACRRMQRTKRNTV